MSESMGLRIAKLEQMTTAQLRQEWREVLGGEPRSSNRAWIFKRLVWAQQAKEYGGLSANRSSYSPPQNINRDYQARQNGASRSAQPRTYSGAPQRGNAGRRR